MSKNVARVKREDSFNLSMVDLFGCGFIAAIFLFILNVLQPQIDAATGSAGAASNSNGRMAEGLNGPLFVSVKSELPLRFPKAGAGSVAPQEQRGMSADDRRFKHSYDHVFPDASAVKWPLEMSFCAASEPTDRDCAQKDASGRRGDVVVRMTLGYTTLTAFFVGKTLGDNVELAFDAKRALSVKVKREFEHQLEIDLRPKRREAASYRSLAWFFSDRPFLAAAGWLGGVEEVSTTTKDQVKERGKALSNVARCWIFAKSGTAGGAPQVLCPEKAEDVQGLVSAVGDEPWRSGVFAQRVDTCSFPFEFATHCVLPTTGLPTASELPILGVRPGWPREFVFGSDRPRR